MIEPIEPYIYVLAAVAVASLGLLRFYAGDSFYDVAWQPIRNLAVPLIHIFAERKLGDDYYAKYDVGEKEHVATLEAHYTDVLEDLESAGYVVEPLAALKTDWNGNEEVASYALHYGDKLFPGAPTWLKERQVHVTLFPRGDANGTIVTAHDEYNSWRPDLVEEHYSGESMNIGLGVRLAAKDLGIEAQLAPSEGDDAS